MNATRSNLPLTAIALSLVAPTLVHAQSNIDDTHKHTWCENVGWMNWRDGNNNPAAGVRFHPGAGGFLTGNIWCENIGWINVGSPIAAGTDRHYDNINNNNFGVNIGPDGYLSGFAWNTSTGWINFDTRAVLGDFYGARFDWRLPIRATFGYAWSENIGWINLEDNRSYIILVCIGDVDDGSGSGLPDGGVTIDDLLYYLQLFENGVPEADVDDGSGSGVPDGGVTIDDLLLYLARFEAGC